MTKKTKKKRRELRIREENRAKADEAQRLKELPVCYIGWGAILMADILMGRPLRKEYHDVKVFW